MSARRRLITLAATGVLVLLGFVGQAVAQTRNEEYRFPASICQPTTTIDILDGLTGGGAWYRQSSSGLMIISCAIPKIGLQSSRWHLLWVSLYKSPYNTGDLYCTAYARDHFSVGGSGATYHAQFGNSELALTAPTLPDYGANTFWAISCTLPPGDLTRVYGIKVVQPILDDIGQF